MALPSLFIRRITFVLLTVLLFGLSGLPPAQAGFTPADGEKPLLGGRTVRGAYLRIYAGSATPIPNQRDVLHNAWLDPGCFSSQSKDIPVILQDKDGNLVGKCRSEEDLLGTHFILTGTLKGKIKGKAIEFQLDLKQEYEGVSAIVKNGKELGRFTEKGSQTVKYIATGEMTATDVGSGNAEFTLTCEVSQTNKQGEVPYGVGGNCPGSSQDRSASSDSGSVAGVLFWVLNFETVIVRTPVIILPGIAGTQLIDDAFLYELWPFAPLPNRAYLGLMPDGKTQAVYAQNHIVKVGEILRSGSTNFYGSLISSLLEMGYVENFDLFTFPYDWRLSNDTHYGRLYHRIEEILANTGEEQVILIAHSMGGVISRGFVYDNPQYASKVKAIITMGTPYWGSPKAFYALVNGYSFGNITVNKNLMKVLGQNWPSAYQLAPRMPFVIDTTTHNLLGLKETYKVKYKYFEGVTENLILRDKYIPTTNNIRSPNSDLVNQATTFYSNVGTRDNPKPLPAGVKQYVIIGCGVKTLGEYDMRPWSPEKDDENAYLTLDDNRKVVFEPRFLDGDGTVPLWAAETAVATETYYVDYHKGEGNSSGHGDLAKNITVQKIVKEILSDTPPKGDQYPYPYLRTARAWVDLEPDIKSWLMFTGYTTDFTLHSDAHLKISNPQGQVVGFNDEGNIDEGIPGSSFLEMESGEYASIPYQGEPFKVELTGFQQGKFTLEVVTTTPEGKQSILTYHEVPVNAGTQAVFDLPSDPSKAAAPVMKVTTGGVSTQITPQLTVKDVQSASQQSSDAAKNNANPAPSGAVQLQGNLLWVALGGSGLVLAGVVLFLATRRARRKPAPVRAYIQQQAQLVRSVPQATPQQPQMPAPVPHVLMVSQGRTTVPYFQLTQTRMIVGRDPAFCAVVLDDPLISRQHACLDYVNGVWLITDMNSSNGLYINGLRIHSHYLRPGDRIRLGHSELTFQ